MRLVSWTVGSLARLPIAAALLSATSLVAALAACAAPATPPSDPAPRIFDVKARRYIDEATLLTALARARYRLLGEVHDNPAHHAIRARLVSALAARGLRPAVVFEQFDLDHEAALREAQSHGVDAEELADAGQLDRRGWQWPLHKPIVEAALRAGLPIHAGNLSRAALDAAQRSSRKPDAPWYARLRAARWSETQARELHDAIAESHCGRLPANVVPRLVLAQRIRDAAMAQALVDDATADGAILIAGNGHVRADLGVPVYLHAPGSPDANAPSIRMGLVEATREDARRPDFPQGLADRGAFDYLWITAKATRDDPCVDFSMPAPTRLR
jgi:uncharacterized iron-regulated protein